jgi:DNA-binding MarR family transcriptional regulator
MKDRIEADAAKGSTAETLLETLPAVMGYVSSELRRSSPIENSVHFRLMRALRRGQRKLHELAEMHSVRLPTMSRTVSVLEGRGWVDRRRSTEDRRTVYVTMTETGEEVLQRVEKMAIARASELLACMSDADVAALQQGLTALHSVIRDHIGIHPDEGEVPPDVAGCTDKE